MKELVILLPLLFTPMNTATYTVEVTEYGYAIITQEIIFTCTSPTESISFYIPFPIDYLEVYSSTVVRGDFIVVGMQTEVTITGSFEQGEDVYCICEYISWQLISKTGTEWELYLPLTDRSLTVIMPEGTEILYLVTESDFPSISDEKGMIHLSWEEIPHDIYLYYRVPLNQQSSLPFMIPLAVLVSGCALVILFMLRKKKKRRLNESILAILNERELCIVQFLYTEGASRQEKISRNCGIPKTSLSKILLKMEERGIITRKRDGNRTYCSLKDTVFE
ncbi:MAG: hypothetical protein HXS53_02290 [Theionarchaea archaeon]|nr:hypothetical protein [Theionarchaea archaeon]